MELTTAYYIVGKKQQRNKKIIAVNVLFMWLAFQNK